METLFSRLWNFRTYFVIYAVIIAVIVSMSFFMLHLVKQSILKTAQERLEFISHYKAEEIRNWINNRKADALVLSENKTFLHETGILVKHPVNSNSKKKVLSLLKPVLKHYNNDGIIIADSSGRIIAGLSASRSHDRDKITMIKHPELPDWDALSSDFYFCSQCYAIHLDLYTHFHAGVGTSSRSGYTIVTRLDPGKFLYPLIQSWPVPSRTSETLLIGINHSAVVYLNELRHQKNTALKLQFPISDPDLPAAMAARGREGIVQGIDYREKKVLASVRSIPDTPWYIVSKTDMEEVFESMTTWKIMTAIVAGILILIIGSIFMMIIYQRRRDHFKNLYELELQREVLSKHNEYLLKYANDIILLGDQNHRIVDCNLKAIQVYGYSREQLLKMSIPDLVAPGFLTTLKDRIRKILDEQGCIIESAHRRKDGSVFPIEISARTITVDGKTFIQSIIRDITSRLESEKALIESEAKYRMLFNTMIEGFSLNELIFDDKNQPVSYKLIDVNPAFEKLTGLHAADILGRNVLEYLPGLEQEWLDKYFHVALTGESFSFEQFNQDLNRYFRVTVFRPAENQFAVVFDDITESQKIQEEIRQLNLELEERVKDRTAQLESSNKELESFSYSVSHDLRAPLRSLDGFSQALMEDYWERLDDGGKRYLNKIRGASQKMAQLIDDLLKLSRITRHELVFEKVDLSKIVQSICSELVAEQPERQVKFNVLEGINVTGDAHLLKIAMENLIQNAWKFTSKKTMGEIEFGHLVKEKHVVLFIKDNGSGFDMKYANKLFGVFQRLHTTEEFPGTGIGLTTVQRIIMRHGGYIWAESEVNNGATFFFTLHG